MGYRKKIWNGFGSGMDNDLPPLNLAWYIYTHTHTQHKSLAIIASLPFQASTKPKSLAIIAPQLLSATPSLHKTQAIVASLSSCSKPSKRWRLCRMEKIEERPWSKLPYLAAPNLPPKAANKLGWTVTQSNPTCLDLIWSIFKDSWIWVGF